MYRDPLDRYRSAWEGKLRCATRSENAEHFITQLLEQAGLPTSYGEVPRDPAHPLPKHFEDLDPEVAWCMSFEDFALAVRRIPAGLRSERPPPSFGRHRPVCPRLAPPTGLTPPPTVADGRPERRLSRFEAYRGPSQYPSPQAIPQSRTGILLLPPPPTPPPTTTHTATRHHHQASMRAGSKPSSTSTSIRRARSRRRLSAASRRGSASRRTTRPSAPQGTSTR